MAQTTFFKTFTNSDRTTTKTLLHEAIPITGAIVEGTYNLNLSTNREKNIKVYSHGMFQSVYDYPFLSSSANHIFDITVGCSKDSSLSASKSDHANIPDYVQIDKKVNIYNQMAQMLMGYELQTKESNGTTYTTTAIRKFDADGDFSNNLGKMDDCIFLSFSRLLTKDEIKKGSFNLTLGIGPHSASAFSQISVKDTDAASNYFINCPAGEYGILYASSSAYTAASNKEYFVRATASSHTNHNTTMWSAEKGHKVGLIFYQAGICVLTSSIFEDGSGTQYDKSSGNLVNRSGGKTGALIKPRTVGGGTGQGVQDADRTAGNAFATVPSSNTVKGPYHQLFTGSTIDAVCDGIRNKIIDVSFNNTTELNSSVFFCRAHHNEFNYSSNPTYLSGSQIRVKTVGANGVGNALAPPRSYITTVGLYAADNELLAVAKLSEPLRKDPTNEVTLRVRLDY